MYVCPHMHVALDVDAADKERGSLSRSLALSLSLSSLSPLLSTLDVDAADKDSLRPRTLVAYGLIN